VKTVLASKLPALAKNAKMDVFVVLGSVSEPVPVSSAKKENSALMENALLMPAMD
jgi:hypothetical protein